MFTWRTIDTKFPPIPVVPRRFQLQEFEGGEKERGEVQKGGQRGEEDCTISAGKRRALVHSLLTVESGEAAGTLAHVAAAIVLLPAFATVEAGRVGTGQQAVLTVGALVARPTSALVAALQILMELKKKVTWLNFCAETKRIASTRSVSSLLCISLHSCRGCCHTPASPAHS